MPTSAVENPLRWCVGRLWRYSVLLAMLVAISTFVSVPAGAAEEESSGVDYPLVLINGASVQRWKDHSAFMFGAAQRPEMSDRVEKMTISTLQDFAGIDRERPFGIMLYL